MRLRTRRKIRKYLGITLGIIILLFALVISYFENKFLETSICIVLFYIYRGMYEKQFHCKSVYLCAFVSFIVLLIIIHLNVSMAVSVILTFIITLVSYYIRDYINNKLLIKVYRDKLKVLDNKAIENLTEDEMINLMPDIKYDILHITYDYLHKPKSVSAINFAYKNSISEATLYRYVKQVKNKYESLREQS